MLLYGAASAAVAFLVKPIIDEALPGDGNLPFWATAILLAYFAKGLGAYFSAFLMTDIGQRVVRDLRDQLFRHTLDQSAEFFSQRTTGHLMSRVTNDVSQVQQAVSETIGDLLRESLALIGYAVLLFYWDYRLALVCVTGAPIVVYPLVRLGQRVRRTSRRSQEELARLSHITAEAFAGHRIVKAFGAEAHEARRFSLASDRLYRTNIKITSTVALLPPLMEFLGGLAVVALIWYGSRKISSGAMTQGNFLAFIFAAFMMYTPVKKLSRVNTNLQQAIAAAERIFEMLDTHSEVTERPGARSLPPLRDNVEFRNVSFVYRDAADSPILQDVSFRVGAGQVIAIVGLSGAGKTTLVNLIPRFYDATGGAILVDGVDIRDVTLRSLRSQVGIVTQETVLFDDTIASNIAYGSPGATAGGHRVGGACRACARIHREARERLRNRYRRAWAAPVRRSAAEAGDRPRAAQELPDTDPRRSHVVARRRIGTARPGRARQPDAQPHGIRDCAPVVDGPASGQDRRARAREGRRDRPARRAPGAQRRRVREAVLVAAVRPRAGSAAGGGAGVLRGDDQEHDGLCLADPRR